MDQLPLHDSRITQWLTGVACPAHLQLGGDGGSLPFLASSRRLCVGDGCGDPPPICKRLLWFLAVDAVSTLEGSYRLDNAKASLDSGLEHAPSLLPVVSTGVGGRGRAGGRAGGDIA